MEPELKTDWKSIWIANLIAFIGSVQGSSIIPTVWPYLKKIDVSTSETLYGIIRGLNALGQIISSIINGYVTNKIENTKPSLIASKILVIVASIAFFLMGIIPAAYIVFFIIFEFIFGVASGAGSVYRTHLAMASVEADRAKVFGAAQLCNALGLIIGPLLQIAFGSIQYPGWKIIDGLYVNVYTAPVYLAAATSIVGIVLLIFLFNGKMRIPKQNSEEEKKSDEVVILRATDSDKTISEDEKQGTSDVEAQAKNIPLNIVAVVVLILTKITSQLVNMMLGTIAPPYMMTAFAMSSNDTIKLQAPMMGVIGLLTIAICGLYMFFKINTKISERFSICTAITTFLVYYIITYPWGFYEGSIPYLHVKGQPAPTSLEEARNDPVLQELIRESKFPNSTIELVGCDLSYEWCQTTPRVNMIVFCVTTIIAMAISMPLITINLDTLYSKVLGPIKQGTLQGLFVGAASILDIFGPVTLAQLYTMYGPKIVWIIVIVVCAVDLFLLIVFYKYLVSWDGKKSNSKSDEIPKIPVSNLRYTRTTSYTMVPSKTT